MAVRIKGNPSSDIEVYLQQSGDNVYLREAKTGYAIVSISNYGGKLILERLSGFLGKPEFDSDSDGKVKVR